MKKYEFHRDGVNWDISVAADRRDAVVDALAAHRGVISAVPHGLNVEKIKVVVSDRLETSDCSEILDICDGVIQGKRLCIIERYERHRWKVSVSRNKRGRIMDTLGQQDAVYLATPWDDQADSIAVRFLVTSQHSEREAVASLIEKLVEEPEKPQRHPILDDVWTLDSLGNLITRKGQYVANVYGHDILVYVPRLLKALEAYTNIRSDDNWQKVCIVIASMGLAFTPST